MRRAGVLVLAFCAVLVASLALSAPPALARPGGASTVPPPTADTAAPTPTAPMPGHPPQGSAPDGSTVGGPRLHTDGVVVADGAPPLPDGLTAPGWLVADLGTRQVLGARDPHGRYYPASTLKTLTLLTLAHRLAPDRVVTATEDDERVEGTRVGLVKGGQYPVSLLFRALILGSGNDVANALARANGGTEVTVAQMNATARSLGAYDTVAGTPSGLDVAGQSSSPYDLALIFRALLADPMTAAVVATPRIQIPPEMGKTGFQVDNEDRLLTGYPGDLGGKNGYTDAARHTFVTAAERGGRRLVVTLMDVDRHVGPSEYDQAARLLDWGFSVPARSTGVGRLVRAGEVAASMSVAASRSAAAAARSTGRAATAGQGDAGAARPGPAAGPPLWALVLAVGALLTAGAVAGRRRLRHRAPGTSEAGSDTGAPIRRPPPRCR